MLLKCTATCLLALALFSIFCDAQSQNPYQHGKQWPTDPQQAKQTFEKPLGWKYPEDPQKETLVQPAEHFEVRHPVPVNTVAVDCSGSIVHVEVKKDMFGIGQFIHPGGLTLGDCAVSAEDNSGQVFIFHYELQLCGSELRFTDDSFIYSYILNYNPQKYGNSPVVRTSKSAVIVECHYPRRQNVSSLALDPLWVPFSAVKVAEELLYFSLKLMTDDWVYERPSNQFFLGNMIHIEASVMQYFHVPLRVYVDSCVATVAADVNSSPRYVFIDNHGCFIDGRVTSSASAFLPGPAENKLRFQLEAFRFEGMESGVMYITCLLKATSTAHTIHEQHRACSYIGNMWKEVSGADAACASCETVSDTVGGGGGGGGSKQQVSGSWTTYGGGSKQQVSGSGTTYGSGSKQQVSGSGTTYGSGTKPVSGSGTTNWGGTKPVSGSGTTNWGGTKPVSGSGTTNWGGSVTGTVSQGGGSTTDSGTQYVKYSTGSLSPRWNVVVGNHPPAERKVRDVSTEEVFDWEGEVTVGPFVIHEKVIKSNI